MRTNSTWTGDSHSFTVDSCFSMWALAWPVPMPTLKRKWRAIFDSHFRMYEGFYSLFLFLFFLLLKTAGIVASNSLETSLISIPTCAPVNLSTSTINIFSRLFWLVKCCITCPLSPTSYNTKKTEFIFLSKCKIFFKNFHVYTAFSLTLNLLWFGWESEMA